MNSTLFDNAARRWGRTVLTAAATLSLGAAVLAAPTAGAAAAPAPNTPVARSASGKTTVGAAAARTAKTSLAGAKGSGRIADAKGVSFTRKFPKNVKMLGGDLKAKDVIGADGRTQITDTASYPNRVAGKLTFTAPNGGTYGCTAFLYDDNTVATAGHCVYFHDNAANVHGWSSNFVFWPGRNGTSTPYGSCGWTNVYSVSGWTSSQNPEYDYGAIKLNCTVGNTVGWFGLQWQTASYDGTQVNITGYPGDKPSNTMWQMSGPIASSATRQLFYSIDTYHGQSGSAVRIPGCGAYCAIAVHTYGLYGGSSYNRGTRITEAAFNNYNTWKA
ncbi:trypsin-like serine peptidase [Actinomadura macrotermitis]|uniref:Serine protease n=1 Tax=Actinomadura macrotermitis TaxID=2585200 RepID=A0A7K0BN11_9ACTN|nr:serine protease [Actinomadura macrotermitis]MQY02543.1 Glutamyl endopeptidase [Actinomadura macrotermitis]